MTKLRVDVAVGSRFHLFDLARELHSQGVLGTLYTGYPRWAAARFGLPPTKVCSFLPYEIANRLLNRLFPHGHVFDYLQMQLHRLFAKWVARKLRPGSNVFVGLSSMSLEALPRAKALGMLTVVERGSSHVDWPIEMLLAEGRRLKVPINVPSELNRSRERAEYAAADYIAVPGAYARDTFISCGIAASKLLINPYGVDLRVFCNSVAERAEAHRRVLTVIHVGRIGLRKGVQDLIRAIDLVPQTRLLLVGGVDPGMDEIIRHPRVTTVGTVPQAELPKYYAQADVFCLLSLDEGFGMVLLQAGAMGMPIIASSATGAVDVYQHGQSALIVKPSSPETVAKHFLSLLNDPALRSRLGSAARHAVEKGYGWSDYGARACANYNAILVNESSGTFLV